MQYSELSHNKQLGSTLTPDPWMEYLGSKEVDADPERSLCQLCLEMRGWYQLLYVLCVELCCIK